MPKRFLFDFQARFVLKQRGECSTVGRLCGFSPHTEGRFLGFFFHSKVKIFWCYPSRIRNKYVINAMLKRFLFDFQARFVLKRRGECKRGRGVPRTKKKKKKKKK